MVDIQSKEVIDKISDELKIQPSLNVPREIGKNIQLTYNVNPTQYTVKTATVTLSDGTVGNMFTTHATKRTFLIGGQISISKDVVATSVASTLRGFLIGDTVIKNLMTMRYEPVTVGSNLNLTKNWIDMPIELEKGTLMSATNSTAIASIDTTMTVFFYETDPI